MVGFSLVPHPAHPPRAVTGVTVEIDAGSDEATLDYRIHGEWAVKVPSPASPLRTDGLWQTTCFELFLKPDDNAGYVEFNFSPSGQWAAYAFDAPREGMREQAMAVPPHVERNGSRWLIDLDFSDLPPEAWALGVTAVIEELDGTKSYWALAHAPGPPDFHNPDCFIARLPAPECP